MEFKKTSNDKWSIISDVPSVIAGYLVFDPEEETYLYALNEWSDGRVSLNATQMQEITDKLAELKIDYELQGYYQQEDYIREMGDGEKSPQQFESENEDSLFI